MWYVKDTQIWRQQRDTLEKWMILKQSGGWDTLRITLPIWTGGLSGLTPPYFILSLQKCRTTGISFNHWAGLHILIASGNLVISHNIKSIFSSTDDTRIIERLRSRSLPVIQGSNQQERGHRKCYHYSRHRGGKGKAIAVKAVVYEHRRYHWVVGNNYYCTELTEPSTPHHKHTVDNIFFRIR